jgi:hypothetical protein
LKNALVRLASATDPIHRAGLPATNVAVFPGVRHMTLARSPEVYARIREWFGAAAEGRVYPSKNQRGSSDPSTLPRFSATYDAIRLVNRLAGAAFHQGLTLLKKANRP